MTMSVQNRKGRPKTAPYFSIFLISGIARWLRAIHIFGLESFGSFFHLKLHLRALFEGPVSGHLDGRKVDEHIFAAGSLDKSIALGGVKPFHNTLFSHYLISYSIPGEPGLTAW